MKLWITKSTWPEDGKTISIYNAADTEREAQEYSAEEVYEGAVVKTVIVEVEFD